MVLLLIYGMVNLHNWEGPALIPEGISRKGEYYFMVFQCQKKIGKKQLDNNQDCLGIKNQHIKDKIIETKIYENRFMRYNECR